MLKLTKQQMAYYDASLEAMKTLRDTLEAFEWELTKDGATDHLNEEDDDYDMLANFHELAISCLSDEQLRFAISVFKALREKYGLQVVEE